MNIGHIKCFLIVVLVLLVACHHKPAWKAYPPDWMEMCWDACEGPFISEKSTPDNCVCAENDAD